MDRRRETWLRALAHRYRKLEDTGHTDGLLVVLVMAGGLSLAGMVLLAFVPSYAVLVFAIALTLIATASVLLTILAMLGDDEQSPPTRSRDPR